MMTGSAELLASIQCFGRIGQLVNHDGRIGSGCLVSKSIVMSSTLRTSLTDPTLPDVCDVFEVMRAYENSTSSAENGVPSCHFTPWRRWKRHTVGLIDS